MKDREPNPYETSLASPRARFYRGKKWNVMIDGEYREVILNHSKMGMATTIYVGNELVYKEGNLTTSRPTADIAFSYGLSELLITIRDRMVGSDYSIWVNGELIDGPDHSGYSVQDDQKKWQFRTGVFAIFLAPIFYFVFGAESYVGPVRCDLLSPIFFLYGAFIVARHYLSKNNA